MTGRVPSQYRALAAYIRRSRDALLAAWHELVAQDPELTTASSISHAQFTDSIPHVLDAFEHALTADDALRETQAVIEQREGASDHGLHRWQQGYDLRETMREWAHLHRCILAQLEQYALEHPELEAQVMRHAREALVRLCGEGACESAARYTRLQQAEAGGRMRDLERAVTELRTLERQRAGMLREAAHDLRGAVGIISNATSVLARATSEGDRLNFYRILDRALGSTQSLLTDLIELTRLEAAQDRVQASAFDASVVLRDLSDSLRGEADTRNLFFHVDGPHSLQVIGDRAKLRRIVQNLVLNAFRATTRGGVTLSWFVPEGQPQERWVLTVQDTGPGLRGEHATPLTRALREATQQAQAAESEEEDHAPGSGATEPPSLSAPLSGQVHQGDAKGGEGIGLSIVKRLCELLGASIQLVTEPGRGTLFRLSFPLKLSTPGASGPLEAPEVRPK
jgi:signal transduction histidine kinase